MTNKPEHTALKPCPFCGTSEKLVVDSLGDNDWFVECEGCRMSLHAYHHSAESAEKHWSTRANTVNDDLVEALDEVCNSVDEHGDICVTYDTLYKCCAALAKARGEV